MKALAIWVAIEISFPPIISKQTRRTIFCSEMAEAHQEDGLKIYTQTVDPKPNNRLRPNVLVHETQGMNVADGSG
jgi:hypothetical protein